MVGVAPHQAAQTIGVGELARVFLQVQHDAGAALGARDGLDREVPVRAGRPAHGFIRRGGGTGAVNDLDASSATMNAE